MELKDSGAEAKQIPVTPLRKVTSLTGPFARFSGEGADVSADGELLAAKDDYLEIRLTDRGITENARDILRRRFPRLLSLRQDEALAGISSARAAKPPGEARGERRCLSADFRDFLSSLYGELPDTSGPDISADASADTAAEIALFNTLLAEAEAEEVL